VNKRNKRQEAPLKNIQTETKPQSNLKVS